MKVLPSGSAYQPAVVIAGDGSNSAVAFQGTANIEQWFSYVAGAGVVPFPDGRGNVFGPFFVAVGLAFPGLLQAVQGAGKLYLTGHSLGATSAAMATALLADCAFSRPNQILFAQPNFCEITFKLGFPGNPTSVNHPLDPVPLLPPDPVTLLTAGDWTPSTFAGFHAVGFPTWPFANGNLPGSLRWLRMDDRNGACQPRCRRFAPLPLPIPPAPPLPLLMKRPAPSLNPLRRCSRLKVASGRPDLPPVRIARN